MHACPCLLCWARTQCCFYSPFWTPDSLGWENSLHSVHPKLSGMAFNKASEWFQLSQPTEIWLGEGNGNPLQYSCLENPRDRGAWWTAIYVRWSHRVGRDWSDLATAAVLTVHIFWQRTGKAVKWDLLTTREMFFFFLVSSQVEHLVRLKELAARGNNLNLLSYVKRQTVDALRPRPFPSMQNHCGQRINSLRVYF